MFKVIIGATESGVSADRQAAVLERVRFYKNLRSHLEAISYQIEKKAAVFTAAVHSVGVRVDIYPHVYRKMGADWRALCAAYIQQTGKLEIFPQNRTEA